jgi:fatty-acid O-methyltransferase
MRRVLWKMQHAFQRQCYTYLHRRVDDELVFMNWGFEDSPPMALPLDLVDEPNRYPIQLYHTTATQNGGLTGKRVLEVGCGRGGGASYLTRTQKPAAYVGLDLNSAGIEFCRRRHRVAGLEFVQGDAQELPFSTASFDAVINVESSHCYPRFDVFLSEVARVLRPGGMFLYTDVRHWFQCDEWDAALNNSAMVVKSSRDIGAEVLRGLELNSPQWEAVWARLLPKFLQSTAPVEGGTLYRDLKSGKQVYRMYCLANG